MPRPKSRSRTGVAEPQARGSVNGGHRATFWGPRQQSPDLYAAIDYEVDARYVGALVGGEVQRSVRNVLRLTEPPEERPVAHLAAKLLVFQLPSSQLVSMKPGEIELTRIPCSLPSRASWRVIPMIAVLFVVWASDGRSLKLRHPFSEAMATTTPRLPFRCGHAERVW
jgi:hypothetical protein